MKSEGVDRASIMEQRPLGNTGLTTSIVGFGASTLGNVFGITDELEGQRAVHLAIDSGINYFDVSPYYGMTLAEKRLGAALEGRRNQVVLGTKCGRYGANSFDFSSRRITASLEESLQRLRTDHVDILLAHDVEFGDFQQIINETIPAMRRLQEQGKAHSIGISGYPLGILTRISETIAVDVILSYCHCNLLANDLDSTLLSVVRTKGIGLVNASPLHMGLLTEQGPPDWHPASPAMRAATKQATGFCRSHGIDLAEIALRYCLDYENVSSTLIGISSREQVLSSIRALEAPPDAEILQELRAILLPVFNTFWVSGRDENQ